MAETASNIAAKKENHFLRLMCAVMLMFICYTHYYPEIEISGLDLNMVIFGMGRFAIPIFFLISGYFTFSKDGHSERSLKRKTLHILYLVIFLKLFYLLLDLIYIPFGLVTVDYAINAFITAETTTMHAWFVYSLLLVYAFWFLLYKLKVDFKWTWLLAIPILVIDLLLTEFLPLFGVETIFGGINTMEAGTWAYPFLGLPFFTFGYYMHKYHEKLDSLIGWKLLTVMLVVGGFLSYFETVAMLNIGQNQCNLMIGSLLVAYSSFMLSFMLKEDQLRCRPLEWMGKYLMPWMYTFFPAAIFITQKILLTGFVDDFIIWDVCGPFIAIAIQCLMAVAMWYLLKTVMKNVKDKKKAKAEASA